MTAFLHCELRINQLIQQDFFCASLNMIHTRNPFHLIACFERFVNSFLPHHLRQEGFKAFPAFGIHADEMRRQFAGKQQGIVHSLRYVLRILPYLPSATGSSGMARSGSR